MDRRAVARLDHPLSGAKRHRVPATRCGGAAGDAIGCKRIDLYGIRHGEVADDDVRKHYRELIGRRIEGCPVAYLVGRKEFFSLELEVSPAVLIPRPDSELLVTECLALAKPLADPTLLDLGTGSGNLVVAIAKHHKTARLTTVDLSAEAQEVAGGMPRSTAWRSGSRFWRATCSGRCWRGWRLTSS